VTETAGPVRVRRRLLADVRPLRQSPEYRRLWFGGALSSLGSRMTGVAVPVQVYALTHSSLAVGMLGLAVAGPLVALGLVGGSFADAVDRRKLVLATTGLRATVSLVLAAQAVLDLRQLWLLYVLIVVQSGLSAIDTPARQTFTPRLVPPELLPAATALGLLSFHVGVIVGPLAAGVLIAAWGLPTAYLADVVSFVFAFYGLARLRPMPPVGDVGRPGLRAVVEGLRFLRSRPVLRTALLVDVNATVFGMPHALFPAFAATHFGGGARTVGLLYAAPAIGGLVGTAFSGPLSHVRRQGLAVLCAASVWGLAIAGFGLASPLWLAVALLVVAGVADVVTVVFRSTIVQLTTPDALRGRINGVDFVVGEGGPRLGDVEAGIVAALSSPAVSAVSGGLACVAGVVALGLAVPAFARYDVRAKAAPAPLSTVDG
jgi:MFS family permease